MEDEVKEEEMRIMRASQGQGKGKEAKVDVRDVYLSQKVKENERREGEERDEGEEDGELKKKGDLGPLVVFACRHLYHQSCLERVLDGMEGGERGFRCPIDG